MRLCLSYSRRQLAATQGSVGYRLILLSRFQH